MKEHICQLIVINSYIQIINPINIYKDTQHFLRVDGKKEFSFLQYLFYTRSACMLQVSVRRFAQCKPNIKHGTTRIELRSIFCARAYELIL